mgnify:CR=1 FL=1
MKYAVVGFGTAGYHAVKKIRELDKEGCIDVYSNTGRAPYNPMLLRIMLLESWNMKECSHLVIWSRYKKK